MAAPEAIVKSEIHIDLSFVLFVPHVVALARINSEPDHSFREDFVGKIIPNELIGSLRYGCERDGYVIVFTGTF